MMTRGARGIVPANRDQVATRGDRRVSNLISVTVTAGGRKLVGPISVSVPEPSVVATVGQNGSGKTSLLRLLAGSWAPSSGRVEVTHGIAYADFDDHGLYPYLSVRDQISTVAEIAGAKSGDIDYFVEVFDLEAHFAKRPGELSRGLVQRLRLVLAFIVPHNVLILDEPAVGLDQPGISALGNCLSFLTSQDRTVLLSTHNPYVVESQVDQVWVMESGEIAGSVPAGRPLEVTRLEQPLSTELAEELPDNGVVYLEEQRLLFAADSCQDYMSTVRSSSHVARSQGASGVHELMGEWSKW